MKVYPSYMTTNNTTPTQPNLLTRSIVVEALGKAWGATFATTDAATDWFAEAFSTHVLKPSLPGERVTEQHLVNVYGTLQAIVDGVRRMMTGMDAYLSDDYLPIDTEGNLALIELDLLGSERGAGFMLGEAGEVVDDGI